MFEIPSLTFHIGTPKTGTTFLQSVLFANRELLAEQGIIYPDFHPHLKRVVFNHSKLALTFDPTTGPRHETYETQDQAASRADLAAIFEADETAQADEAAQSDQRWLLSTESATKLGDDAAAELHSFLAEYFDDITIIVYLRRREFELTSRYSQRVKSGRSDVSWERLVGLLEERGPLALVERWSRLVGPDKVIVRPFYEDFKAMPDAVLVDFCEQVGIDRQSLALPTEEPELRNPKLSAEGVEFMRIVNQAAPQGAYSGRRGFRLRRNIIMRVQEITDPQSFVAPDAVLARARQEYQSSNEAVVERLGATQEWRRWLDQPIPMVGGEPVLITEERVAELMEQLSVPNGPVNFDAADWLPEKPKAKKKSKRRFGLPLSR